MTSPTQLHRNDHRWNASPKLEAGGSPGGMDFLELSRHMRREGFTEAQMSSCKTVAELTELRLDSMPGDTSAEET